MRIRTRSIIILSKGRSQLVVIMLAMILVCVISKHEFGTYRQVNMMFVFLTGVVSLQLGNSLFYFVPKLDQMQRGLLLTQTFFLTLVTSTIIACIEDY